MEGLKKVQIMLNNVEIYSKIVAGFGCKRNVYELVVKDVTLFYTKINFYCIRKQEKLKKWREGELERTSPSLSPPSRIVTENDTKKGITFLV